MANYDQEWFWFAWIKQLDTDRMLLNERKRDINDTCNQNLVVSIFVLTFSRVGSAFMKNGTHNRTTDCHHEIGSWTNVHSANNNNNNHKKPTKKALESHRKYDEFIKSINLQVTLVWVGVCECVVYSRCSICILW